ncbi:MAG: T9SS type A sorting domain-containing protein [bacterium]|nr:T9SS type A sorting domain-containing protein [bacterium]
MNRFTILFFASVLLSDLVAAQEPIVLDESFSEWANIADIANPNGDEGNSSIKLVSDEEYLYIYFEAVEEVSIQNSPQIYLYLDTDNDAATGQSWHGVGAEIVIDFGRRTVTSELGGVTETIGFADIDLHLMPTVWSSQFEVAIRRDASVNGTSVFANEDIRVQVEDEDNNISPISGGGALYTFETVDFEELPSFSFNKTDDEFIRIISHNVLRDNMFEASLFDSYKRVYEFLDPEIIGFQEIYNHSAQETAELVEQFLPSGEGEQWYAAQESDNILVSRFPILEYGNMNGTNNGRFLLNLEDYNSQMFVINAHTPCCTNHDGRELEIDAMMAYLRDEKEDMAEFTPIVIMGDMNLVGDPQNIQTLIDGDIQDEDTWGPDFKPDWDGTNLVDVKPLVAEEPMTFTHWSGTGSGRYSTGRLDAMFYSDSRLELKNSYVLYTPSLSDEQLTSLGLESSDSWGSDHLPIVTDFRLKEFSYENTNVIIEELKENDEVGVPELLGTVITVSGVVTASDEFGTNGPAFMQNDEYGVAIFDSPLISQIHTMDSITIRGEVGFFNGLTQIVNFAASDIIVHEEQNMSIDPLRIDLSDLQLNGYERYEGLLVELNGVTVNSTGGFTGGNYILTQGQDETTLRVDFDTDIINEPIPADTFTIRGIINQFDSESPYDEGYQIMPRSLDDLVLGTVTSTSESLNTLEVYPIPTGDFLNIASTKNIIGLTISDQTGRICFSKKPESADIQLDIRNLQNGIYILSISFANGSIHTQKIVID